MSERPTPETDAAERMAFAQEYMVPTAFARKLERERDEAREALENHTTATIHTCHSECKRPMCVLRRERDQAMELCLKLSDLAAYGLGQSGEPWFLDAMRQATAAIQKTKQMGTLPTD